MKKLLILFLSLIFISPAALGKTFKMTAELLEPFNSANPPSTIKTRVMGDYIFNEKEAILDGTMFTGNVIVIVEPKRGKRDGYFYCRLTDYTKTANGANYTIPINNDLIVKVKLYKPFDKKEFAIDTTVSAAGLFVNYISFPVNFARGVIKPYGDKSRMASGVQKVYEKSFMSYISKGDTMHLNAGDKIILEFAYKVDTAAVEADTTTVEAETTTVEAETTAVETDL